MEYGSEIKVATIVLWNFFALIINVIAFVIMYMKANKNASLKAFFIVQASMIIWLVGKIFKTVSPTVELRWFFIVFYYLGICLLGASFLDFSYIYYKGKPIKKHLRICIYLVALTQFLIVATNPYHHMFYSVYGFWGDEFGKLFYLQMVITYLFILTGMFLCSIKFKYHIKDKTKLERNIISIAILVPIVLNFLYITRVLELLFTKIGIGVQIFDITPIVYTWSILIFVYATFKYEFFALTPIMKHEVARKIDNPIVIIDSNLEVLYTNDQFDNLFQNKSGLIKKLNISKDYSGERVIRYDDCYYNYYVKKHLGIGGEKFIIGFIDVTAYKMAKYELDKENNELSILTLKLKSQIEMLKEASHVGARNYIAREMHDILGHSLVAAIKLLEVSKMYYKHKKDRAVNSLEKAYNAIENGFEEMKNINSKDSTSIYSTAALEKEIRSMLKVVDVSGIKVDCFVRGNSKIIDEKIYDTLKKIVTELVTNTLKHSNATKLLLSIMVNDNKIFIQIMDNGKGVGNLVKGNGLIGIDDRLSMINGKAKYSSEVKEGFTSNITIPL